MATALVIALLPVVAGLLLGLSPVFGRGQAGPARTFALAAALAVVLLELLPASGAALGAAGLGLFGAALVLPVVLERVATRLRRGRDLGAELGFAGVLLHQVVDGAEIGAALGIDGGRGVALGIAAHSVPLVAVVIEPFVRRGGPWQVAVRAALLVGATAAGLGLASWGSPLLHAAHGWLPAILGGLLLHILWHGLGEDPPRTSGGRTAELVALIAGCGLVALLLDAHDADGHHPRGFADALLGLTLASGPVLLVGLLVGALVRAGRPGVLAARGAGGRLLQAARGVSAAARLPLCASGLLTRARRHQARSAHVAFVVALVLAAPGLGVEALALSVHLLGAPFAALRLGATLLASLVAAVVVASAARPPHAHAEGAPAGPSRTVLAALDEALLHIGPWMAIGLVAAAAVHAFVTPEQIAALARTGLDLPLVSAISVPVYVEASAAVPLASVLWAKGLGPGAALAGLVLGPAFNVVTVGFLARAYGGRAAALGVAAFVAVTGAFALAAHAILPAAAPLVASAREAGPGPLAALATALLGALVLRTVWLVGPRAWLARVGEWGGRDSHPPSEAPPHEAPARAKA